MSESDNLDFRYAVANTEILIPPSGMLETFGNTLVNYIVVSELMDSVGKCHVRSGRMKLFKPQIITPSAYSEMLLEGFGEEARKYVRWLAEHEDDVHVLRYGYTLKRESFSEELVSRPIDAVLADAAKDVAARKDPYLALVRGVDERGRGGAFARRAAGDRGGVRGGGEGPLAREAPRRAAAETRRLLRLRGALFRADEGLAFFPLAFGGALC